MALQKYFFDFVPNKYFLWESNFEISVLASLEPRIRFVIYICCSLTELPWNKATLDISDYSKWKENDIETSGHWQRIQDNLLLSLIKKMLNHGPSKRYNLNQIKNHLWFKKKFKDSGTPMINSFFPVFLHLLYFWFWFCICTPLSFIRVSKFLLLVWFCNPIILF